MRFDDRRYRWILRLLPGSFRDEHEREMLRLWRDESADAPRGSDSRLWRAALKDTVRTAPREHLFTWARDLRHAARGLRKSPVFAAAAIVTLALGTGATGAVFSLLNTVVLRPLPWRAAERVGLVWAMPPRAERSWLSFPELEDLSHDVASFASVAGLTDVRFVFSDADAADEVQALAVSHTLLSTLGIRPALGRDFAQDDDREGAPPAVMLSHDFWRSRFGADASIVGRTITLNDRAYAVAGILPEEFEILPASSVLPDRPDLLVALGPHLASRDRTVRFLHALVRLRDGASFAQANRELGALAGRAQAAFPRAYPGGSWSFSTMAFQDEVLAGVRTPLFVTFGLVLLVLLMACANVANLLLARGEARRAELIVKAALGAGPGRLAGELMAETLVLAVAGCALGFAVAAFTPPLLRAIDPTALPRLERLGVDWRVAGFMSGLVLLTAVVFGLAPMAERFRLRAQLSSVTSRSGGRSVRAARASRLLVVGQTMLATMVVVTALFLVRTFVELQRVDLGFDPRGVITARLTRPPQQGAPADSVAFFDRVLAAAARQPGVSAAGAITQLPLSGALLGSTFLAPGDEERRLDSDLRGVTPGYFGAAGMRLLAGRMFDDHDLDTTRPIAVVDQAFARQLRPDGNVVGQFITWIRQPDARIEIVGIVGSVHHRGAADPVRETVYRPHTQYPRSSMFVAIRAGGVPAAAVEALATAVRAVDRHQPLADVASLDDRVRRSTVRARTSLILASVLAALGLTLAAVGLYGVLSFGVSQRLREFGVRLSLGATPRAVSSVVLIEGLRLSLAGITLGLLAAGAVVRSVSAVLYGTQASDLRQYAAAASVVLACSAIAFWLPARRAAGSDPLAVLRGE